MTINYSALQPDENYRIELPAKIWLMDNHKWALVAWEQHRASTKGKRYTLIHADYHWDGVDDFHNDALAQTVLAAADTCDLQKMVATEERIQFDSFIAPAVRRGLVDELHMYCLQDDGSDEGLSNELCKIMGVTQVLHRDVASLRDVTAKSPLLFDLCLDLFTDGTALYGEGEPWPDVEIHAFIDAMTDHITRAELVTISLSFGYSGTAAITRHLASIVVPRVLELRQATAGH